MKLLLFCVFATVLVALSACSDTSPNSIIIEESSSGEEIVLPLNGSLKIALKANAMLGYSWNEEFTIDNDSVLKQTNYVYKDTVTPSIATQLWTFTAVGNGKTTITNEYGGFNIPTKNKKSFTLFIIVKQKYKKCQQMDPCC